jgi:chromate transporter
MSALPAEDHPHPTSLTDLFLSFTFLALQGFGGVMAIVQRELVEKKRWLTREEFVEDWAVAQVLPGPNVLNLALMIGGRYFGLKGALVSLAGILAAPMCVVLMLAVSYAQFSSYPAVAGALRGMGAVAAGLVTATGLKMIASLRSNALGLRFCAALGIACFVSLVVLRLPLVYVMLSLGMLSCVVAYSALKRAAA